MKKTKIALLCILGVILLAIVAFIGVSVYVVSDNNKYKGDYSEVVKSSNPAAQKALVVYQPSRGNTAKEIADQLAKGLNEAGYEVTLSYPGKHLSLDIGKYSVVAFGSPVFMGKVSKALTDYMVEIGDFSGKKVILYSIGMLDKSEELDKMEKDLMGAAAYKKVKFVKSHKDNGTVAYQLGKGIE